MCWGVLEGFMRTPEELNHLFLEQLRSVYKRPSMYGSPSEIESALWWAHRAWALVHRREDEFQSIYNRMHRERKAPRGLYEQFRGELPDGSDADAYNFVLGNWASITMQLGITVDLESANPAIEPTT
jgi:hypothetical protein